MHNFSDVSRLCARRPKAGLFRRSALLKAVGIGVLATGSLLAQQDPGESSGTARAVTAASQFFDNDFVNVYAFANGIWDSRLPQFSGSTTNSTGSSLGWEAGGGISAAHRFRGGDLGLNYRGDYRDYSSTTFSGGTNQTLSFALNKRLSRRWNFSTSVSGGIVSYGTGYFSGVNTGASIAPNPFSSQSRFLNAGVSLSYAATRRLSYVFSGSYFLGNYTYANAFNSYGFTGAASMLYRLTSRTTVGLNYAHSYYTYSGSTGTTNIDGGSLSISHVFSHHWQIDLSGGVNRSHSTGTIVVPVSAIFNGQTVTGYFTGPYDRTVISPSYQGTITHYQRHSSLSLSGGQSVLPGNGVYLASRNQFLSGAFSVSSSRRTTFGLGGGYFRLSSIANDVSSTYSTANFSANFGVNLVRYISANVRYDFIHYDGLFVYNGLNESRLSFGLSFSSKSIPLTLY